MRFRSLSWVSALAIVAACADEAAVTGPRTLVPEVMRNGSGGTTVVVVTPGTLNGACQTVAVPVPCGVQYPSGWLFYNDEVDQGDPSLGSFVAGPAPTLYGAGSAQISVSGSQRRNLATYQFAGTPLASITALSFRTYNPSAGNGGSATRSAYLNFNVDFDGSDTWQRRLVFVPRNNGTVLQNTWQEWDAIGSGNAKWSLSGGTWPGTATPGSTLRTWDDILSSYPGVRIRITDAHLGLRVGEPYTDGYTENIDAFTFGTAAGTTIFDFEPDLAPPVVTNVLATANPAAVSTAVTLTADVSDAATGGSDVVSAEYSVDNGSWSPMSAADLAFDEATESLTATLTAPSAAGISSICVKGTDAQGLTSTPVCISLVVYDPSAGFVTGGGWIDSPSGSLAPSLVWDQNFETDASGWSDASSSWYGSIARVTTGASGIVSYSGASHAEVSGDGSSAPFSRFDGYRSAWNGTWVAKIAVYLDPAWASGSSFDYSVASSNSSGAHLRDFIFHITKDNSTGKLLVAGSNNTNFAPRQDLENINHYEVTTAGWYTLRHTFRDQGGVLAVDLQLLDANGVVLWTETRSTPSDLIPSVVGGNRYAWFTHITGITLAIDDHQLIVPVLGDPTGKATFGFVSKYQKGKSTPTGQTEFVFNAGNINFHSSAYDWLIVNQAGTNAQFKGSGTINGAGNYSFMLWAGDGDKDTNPSTLDTFRIKIWDTATNQVVYDNQADTVISGGNIIVHVPKK